MTQPPNASDMPGSLATPSPGEDFGKFETIAQITAAVSPLTADGNGNMHSDPANAGYPIADAWANASKLFQDALERLRTIQDEFVAALKTARDALQGAAGDEFQYLASRVLERSRIVSDSLNGYSATVDAIGAAIRNFNSTYWQTVANILDQNVADQQKVQAVVAQAYAAGLQVDGQALATTVEQRDEREVWVPELRDLLVNLATQYQNYGSNLVPLHAMPTPKSGNVGAPSKNGTTTLNVGHHRQAFQSGTLQSPGPQVRTGSRPAPITKHTTAPVAHTGSAPHTRHTNQPAAGHVVHNPGGTPPGNVPANEHLGKTGATRQHNDRQSGGHAGQLPGHGHAVRHDGGNVGELPGHGPGGSTVHDGRESGRHVGQLPGHEHGGTTGRDGRPADHQNQRPATTSHGPNGTTSAVPATHAAGIGGNSKEAAAQKQRQQTLEQARKAADGAIQKLEHQPGLSDSPTGKQALRDAQQAVDHAIQKLEHQPGLGHSPIGKVREQALHDTQQAVDHAIQKMEHATNPGHISPTGKHGETNRFVTTPGGNNSGKDHSARNRWGVTAPFTSHKGSTTEHALGKNDSTAAAREKALHDAQQAADHAIRNLDSPGGPGPKSGSKVKPVTLSGKQPTDRSTTPATSSNGPGKDQTGHDRGGAPLPDLQHGHHNLPKAPVTSTNGPKSASGSGSTSHLGSTSSGQEQHDGARERVLEQARHAADDAIKGLEGGGLGPTPPGRIHPVSLGSAPTHTGAGSLTHSGSGSPTSSTHSGSGLPTHSGSGSPALPSHSGSGSSLPSGTGSGHSGSGSGVPDGSSGQEQHDGARERVLEQARHAADDAIKGLEGGGLGPTPPGRIHPVSLGSAPTHTGAGSLTHSGSGSPTSPTSPTTTGSGPTDPVSPSTPTDHDSDASTPTVDPSLRKAQQDALDALHGLNNPTDTGPTHNGSIPPVSLGNTGSGASGGGDQPAAGGQQPAGVGHDETSSATNDAAQQQRALHDAQVAADKAIQQLENGGGLGSNPSTTLPSTMPGHVTPRSPSGLHNPTNPDNPTGTALHDAQNAIDRAIEALPGFNAHDATGNTLHAAEKAINDAIGSLPGAGGALGHSARSSLDGMPGGTSLLDSDVASQSGFTRPDGSASPTTPPTTPAGTGGIRGNAADGGGGMPMMPMGGMGGAAGGSEQSREPSVWLQADEKHWRDDENAAPPVIGRS